MARTGDRNDPFVAFRFEIRFDDLPVGGFSELSGLRLETEVQDHAEGGLNEHVHRFPGRTTQSNLTLKRGVVDREVHDWYSALVQGDVRRRDFSVIVYDTTGTEVVMEWHVRRAWPCKWEGPDLNASQSSVAVETVELCHDGIVRRN